MSTLNTFWILDGLWVSQSDIRDRTSRAAITGLLNSSADDLFTNAKISEVNLIIRNWNHATIVEYLNIVIQEDALLGDVFEIQWQKLAVKEENSRILDAHFGWDMKVVPGVIIKRLLQKIFGLNLYALNNDSRRIFQTDFHAALRPGDTIFIGIPESIGELFNLKSISKWVQDAKIVAKIWIEFIATEQQEALKSILKVFDDLLSHHSNTNEEISTLTTTFQFTTDEEVISLLAQKPKFTFVSNIVAVDSTQAQYFSVISLEKILDQWGSLELLEEAICQAVTLGIQTIPGAKSDCVITLKSSRVVAHQKFDEILTDRVIVVFQILPGLTEREKIVNFVAKSPTDNMVMSGQIQGTSIPKKVFTRSLRSK